MTNAAASSPSLQDCQRLMDEGHVSPAIAGFGKLMAASPNDLVALNGLAAGLQSLGRHDESAAAFVHLLQLARKPLALRVASNYLMELQYSPSASAQLLVQQAKTLGPQFGVQDFPWSAPAGGDKRLRVGFVSADLTDHPVGMLLLPLLIFLDTRRFTPILYATGGREDTTSAALKRFAAWQDVSALDNEALLHRLRDDGLDILVDLSGHTAGNRLPVFARRAARLQVSWLGYFATTGIAAMDCVLMDPWLVPPEHESQFTEDVLRMPVSRWCYNPPGFAPAVSPPPSVARGHVTFGSFNNTAKYSAALFAVWARVLAQVPDSRLVLKWKTFVDEPYCEWVLTTFESHGISRDRLELRPRSFHREVLEQYADIDIALDPFPFAGGMTSCEALWMGLPVVTLAGERTVSRQTLGLIASLGRKDWLDAWVARDVDTYVRCAAALAGDLLALARTRGAIRGVMKASPLTDGQLFASNFGEVLYEKYLHLGVDDGGHWS